MQECLAIHEEDGLSATLRGLREQLACPRCHGFIRTAGDGWQCGNADCRAAFSAIDGIPILLNPERSLFDAETFLQKQSTFFKPVGNVRRRLSGWLPTLSANVAARTNCRRLREELRPHAERPRVLVLGGSILGDGLDVLADDPTVELIETDVALGPRTQLICDAHDLPFGDATFDAVILQAVLEHVLDPARCIDEVHRVLRRNGLVYADTPFMQQVHGREFDFTRFTRLGHRRLFRRFREVDSGITCGPGMALAWSAQYFLLSFFGGRTSRAIVCGLSRATLFWLKYFDYYLAHRPAAADAASGFYFLGEKGGDVLADRDLIAAYRGGF